MAGTTVCSLGTIPRVAGLWKRESKGPSEAVDGGQGVHLEDSEEGRDCLS